MDSRFFIFYILKNAKFNTFTKKIRYNEKMDCFRQKSAY